jgi:hypothetical protein
VYLTAIFLRLVLSRSYLAVMVGLILKGIGGGEKRSLNRWKLIADPLGTDRCFQRVDSLIIKLDREIE